MTIEEKAHEAHNANRALKEKYHIPYQAWIDWFTLGYRRAEKDCKPKWIPIGDREHQAPNDKVCLLRLEDGSIVRDTEEWEDCRLLVTHWMPIPEFNE